MKQETHINTSFLNFDIYPTVSSLQNNSIRLHGQCNLNGICIIYNIPFLSSLSEFFNKILNSIGYNLYENVVLLDLTENEGIQFKDIEKEVPAKRFIAVGCRPNDFSLPIETFKYYEWIEFNHKKLLFIDELASLSKNREKKILLWNVLKKEFLAD